MCIIKKILGEGIKEAVKQSDIARGARPNLANKIMLLFTDGWGNKGPEPEGEARAAEAAGFRLLSVAVIVIFQMKFLNN